MCTVDVSCGVADLISHRVSQLLTGDMCISPISTINTVVVFSFSKLPVWRQGSRHGPFDVMGHVLFLSRILRPRFVRVFLR